MGKGQGTVRGGTEEEVMMLVMDAWMTKDYDLDDRVMNDWYDDRVWGMKHTAANEMCITQKLHRLSASRWVGERSNLR